LFELQDLGPKDLKGIAEPVTAWEALHASSVESRFEALRAHSDNAARRSRRGDRASDASLDAGHSWRWLYRADLRRAGIGKSRLTEALHARIRTEPHTRLRFFCSPYHQDSALHPAIAQLERAAGFHRDDTVEERLSKLEALLAQATNDVTGVAPLFADLLSIPTGERYPALNLTPQKRKEF
jgi:hypothetical protein